MEHVCHHKNPESSSQHSSDDILSDSPTAIQQSMEKRGRKSPRRCGFEEGKEGDRIGGGEVRPQSSKRMKRYKGK